MREGMGAGKAEGGGNEKETWKRQRKEGEKEYGMAYGKGTWMVDRMATERASWMANWQVAEKASWTATAKASWMAHWRGSCMTMGRTSAMS